MESKGKGGVPGKKKKKQKKNKMMQLNT